MWRNSCVKANAIRKFGIILEVGLILWLDFAWIQVFLVLLHYCPKMKAIQVWSKSRSQEFKRNDEQLVHTMLKEFLKRDCIGLALG